MGGKQSRTKIAIPLLVGLIFLGGAVGFGYHAFTTDETAEQRLANAKEVNATVLQNDVRREPNSNEAGNIADFRVDIQFEYTYDGERYRSDLLYPTASEVKFDREEDALTIADAHEEGETVTAYLDPAHPDEAFLIDQKQSTLQFNLLLLGILSILGLLLFADGLRRLVTRRR